MKNLLLLLSLAGSLGVSAQSFDEATAKAGIVAQGGYFALSVPDVEASAKWYEDALGLKVVRSFPKDAYSDGVKALAGGGLLVELVQLPDALPLSSAAPTHSKLGQVHGIFKVGAIVDDLDALLARLKSHGVPIYSGPSPARPNEMRGVQILDNAGNLLQFLGRK